MKKNGVLLLMIAVAMFILLGGCFQGEQTFQEIDVPEEVTLVDDNGEALDEGDELDAAVKETEETIALEVYLFDADGVVAPVNIEIPRTKSVAMTALQHMIKDGPVAEMLPNGFQAVLPANTEILGLNLQEDGTIIVDVSEEFKNYAAEDELEILQAMTFTLTQFDNIERMKLWINGENQEEMPVNGTPISIGYSPKQGINIYVEDKPNVRFMEPVTIFYPKKYNDFSYHVPVTKYVNVRDYDLVTSIIESMFDTPIYEFGTLPVFNMAGELVEQPKMEDGVLQLKFNEEILIDKEKGIIANEVLQSLVKSLTLVEDVESVKIDIENQPSIMDENGNIYDRPVNIQDFRQQEKM